MNVPEPPRYPKLACLCCTYARPRLLEQAVESYLRQDYPSDRVELIVLDDAGQYVSQVHESPMRWQIVSTAQRFRTLGEKRNATAALVSDDVDAYVVWDDDDIYLPWTLKAHAAALTRAPWSLPSRVLVEKPGDERLQEKETGGLFHSAWAFSRELFAAVSGYPFMQSGQDQALAARFKRQGRQVRRGRSQLVLPRHGDRALPLVACGNDANGGESADRDLKFTLPSGRVDPSGPERGDVPSPAARASDPPARREGEIDSPNAFSGQTLTADPIALGYEPFLVYRWETTESWHMSALDRRRGYQRLGQQRHQGPPIQEIQPHWPREYTADQPDCCNQPTPGTVASDNASCKQPGSYRALHIQ